jgi:cytidylate kinase
MYFITISHMLGTGGEEVAKEVSKKLNYAYYGEGELRQAAAETGFSKETEHLEERSPDFFERYFSEKPAIYLGRTQALIYEVAKQGNAVFSGRGSQLLLRAFDCALHVLVTGSRKKRIETVMKANGVERDLAERMIDRSDHDKKGFLKFAFDKDWLDPKLYDLVLNTDKLSLESATRMIVDAANSEEIKICGTDSVRLLGRLCVTRRIESTLLEEGWTPSRIFFDFENENAVRLYGVVTAPEEKERIGELLAGIRGIEKVKNDLTVFTGPMEM